VHETSNGSTTTNIPFLVAAPPPAEGGMLKALSLKMRPKVSKADTLLAEALARLLAEAVQQKLDLLESRGGNVEALVLTAREYRFKAPPAPRTQHSVSPAATRAKRAPPAAKQRHAVPSVRRASMPVRKPLLRAQGGTRARRAPADARCAPSAAGGQVRLPRAA